MNHMLPVFVLAVIFGGIALVIHLITSHRLKVRIINAGKLELDPEMVKALYRSSSDNKLASLKWGLVSLLGGIGLIIIEFCQFEINSALPWGIELASVATGFLLYFFIAKQMESE